MAQLDRLGWAAHHTYQFGRTYLGMRSTDVRFSDAVAEGLHANLRAGISAPANFSIILPRDNGSTVNLAALYHRHRQVLRTSDLARLTRGILSHFGSYTTVPKMFAVRMSVAIQGDFAALVPPGISLLPQSLVRNLQRENIELHDSPWVEVDLDRGQVVIPDLALSVNETPFEQFVGGAAVQPRAGRFSLAGMVEEASPGTDPTLLSRAARFLQASVNLDAVGIEATVARLLALISEMPPRPVFGRGRELAEAVALSLR